MRKLLVCLSVLGGALSLYAFPADVTFRWDYDAPSAAGFALYCGSSSRAYSARMDVGNTETYTIGAFPEGASFCAVTAYDPARIESAYSDEISVDVPYTLPTPSFSADRTSGAAPMSVVFRDTSVGHVTTWAWDFGDGTTSSAQSPIHVYGTPGSYQVALTVTGGGGMRRTAPATISVGAPVSSPQALGLVGAYAFDAGAGGAAADASGNGHHGTLSSGVAWSSQGKFGNALVFNGFDALVTIPDSPGLRLTTGMTLEAWVKASAVSSAWRDVIFKGDDDYYLEATSTSNRRPAGGGTFGKAFGTAALATNTWTHLAVTYDKAKLRLYVNGVQVSSVTRTGNIATSASPLQIGGDSIYGQYFQGVIDEVRVYNRALTQAQIQADMNTPVTPIAPDTSAPTVAIAIPTSAATFTTGSSELTLGGTATDDNRVTEVSWASDRGASGTARGTTGWAASGIVLQPGSNVLTVTARDAANNAGAASVTVTYVLPDYTAPNLSITTPRSYATVSGATTLTAAAADNIGVVGVQFLLDGVVLGTEQSGPSYSLSWDTRSVSNGVHRLSASARDAAGNTAFADTITVTVLNGVSPTPTGFRMGFSVPFDPALLEMFAQDVTLVGATSGPVRGSLAIAEGNQAFTFIKTGGVLAADTYTLTIASRLNGMLGEGVYGNDYRLAFAIASSDTPVLAIGEFARGPGQPVNLPAADIAAGIPVRISSGAAVREVAFALHYNPALLIVQDISLGRSVTGDLTLKSVDQLSGVAQVRVTNLSGLTNASTVLLRVQAQVPSDAHYGAQHLLDIDNLVFNGGALGGRDDDGLHLVAKLGEPSGDSEYSSSDAMLIQRVIVRLDTRFSAYPLTDPVVVGDVNDNGRLDSADALLIQYKASGQPIPQIPD